MALGRRIPPPNLSNEDFQKLQSIANSRSYPFSMVQQAQIVLAFGAEEVNTATAKQMCLSGMTVDKRRKRYIQLGMKGLHVELKSGRLRIHEKIRWRM